MTSESRIQILLVDDEPLAIEGWKEILSKADDFEVIGSVAPEKIIKTLPSLPPFEIALSGKSLLNSSEKNLIEALKRSGPRVKVVLAVETESEIMRAQSVGADEAILAPFKRRELENLIKGLSQDPKRRCAYFAQCLDEIHVSEAESGRYEELISSILQFIFSQHLSNMQRQFHKFKKEREYSVIMLNRCTYPFWKSLYEKHQAERILFDVRNIRTLDSEHVSRLGKRLTPEIGNLGVLVSRSFPSCPAEITRDALFTNSRSLVLFLSDAQIRSILAQKAVGVDPSELFEDIYQQAVTSIAANHSS